MSDKEFDRECLKMLRALKKMDENTYLECKLRLLAVTAWSVATHNFVVELFKIADKARPLLIEMKAGATV